MHVFIPFPFGRIRPTGWLNDQMRRDLNGFVGHLDQILPDLMNDPIYGSGRLHGRSAAKDLGNLKSGDAEGDDQYKWWNSETQSNWWDGFLRTVFLIQDADGMRKAALYVQSILRTQDEDGYLGIYDKELRYAFSSENGELWSKATTISGGAIGDEWIHGRRADATHTGYEYCSLHELLDSYALLLQKSGDVHVADDIERTFFNAAQGARHPQQSCIAYLKTDNSYDMRGTRNGEAEPDRIQTRYKYSAAHQDVAVCCAPNAGRISPYFVQNAWMRQNETTLVATLLMPCVLDATLDGHPIRIETITEYPFANEFRWVIRQSAASGFTLKIRKPSWVDQVVTYEPFTEDQGYILIERTFSAEDEIRLEFKTQVRIHTDPAGSTYFTHGALLYALPIEAREIKGRRYAPAFEDIEYEPVSTARYAADPGAPATYREGRIETSLINQATGKAEGVSLVPIGTTILRQVTF